MYIDAYVCECFHIPLSVIYYIIETLIIMSFKKITFSEKLVIVLAQLKLVSRPIIT